MPEREFVVCSGYDKRGTGQSGGRTERVTLQDYADDAVAAVKWLAKRKDVDPERIFVVGHSEGASVGMLAAAAEKKVEGLVLMSGMAIPGRELILEQQQHVLSATNVPEAERTQKVELQKQILEAAMTEKGWESLPPDVRGLVDTPWYPRPAGLRPSKVMTKVKQPILVLQETSTFR